MLKTPAEPECLKVVMNGNVFLSSPFLHVKIHTELSHSPWHPETSSLAGDKNTGEQLPVTWRDGQSMLKVVVRLLKSVSRANMSASNRRSWFLNCSVNRVQVRAQKHLILLRAIEV